MTLRFSLVTGFALLTMSCLSTLVRSTIERQSLIRNLENQAARVADLLAANVAGALFTFNREGLDAAVASFSSDPTIRYLEIKDATGKIVAHADNGKDRGDVVTVSRQIKSLAVAEPPGLSIRSTTAATFGSSLAFRRAAIMLVEPIDELPNMSLADLPSVIGPTA